MKTKNLMLAALLIVITHSGTTSFYQVYKATAVDKIALNNNLLVYEDENCRVSYNLWDEGGSIGFRFYNKTDQNIFLNLEESFFVFNGFAYNYYKNRTFTDSKSSGASATRSIASAKSVTGLNYLDLIQTNSTSASNVYGIASVSGYSVSYVEEKMICIPPKTIKIISEYSINNLLYRDCDLKKFPTKKDITKKTFTKSDSPITFSNRIAYTIGQSDNQIKFENEFYVSEISNYPESEILESKYEESCGEKSRTLTKHFKNAAPDKFYIKYTKGANETDF